LLLYFINKTKNSQERETLMLLKNFTPNEQIPESLMKQGAGTIKQVKTEKLFFIFFFSTSILFVFPIKQAMGNFDKSRGIDKDNEKRPLTPHPSLTSNMKLHNMRESQEDLIKMLRVSYDDILAETRKNPSVRRPSIEIGEKSNPLAKSSRW
jgi:hypothetical protein